MQALHTGRAYVVHSLRFSTQAWIVGFMIWGDDINTYGTSYINWIQTRIMLRSMAARYEAGSYGYCTIVFLAILVEIQSVVVPALLAFTASGVYLMHYEGNLHELANLYLMSRRTPSPCVDFGHVSCR